MSQAPAIGGAREMRKKLPPSTARPLAYARAARAGTTSLLMLDPDLAEGLVPEAQALLRERMLVRVEPFLAGDWAPSHSHRGVSALLVIDGLLVREVQVAGRTSAELFGAGDMIHPPHEAGDPSATPAGRWKALVPGHLALLDDRLLGSVNRSFPLLFALTGRATRRGRTLGALALTRTMRRTEDRLLFLLTLLAARWGRIRPDGIRLALPVSHELLARLIGTRRQAVTTALGGLRARGLITVLANGDWLLTDYPSLSRPPVAAAGGGPASIGVAAGEVNLLHADAGLAGVLSSAQLARAAPRARVQTRLLSPGRWNPPETGEASSNLGVLVLDGFLSLETSYCGESALEIVGPRDLLRPWDRELGYPLPAISSRWRVLTPTTVALLDERLAARIAAWPALTSEILARAGRRARWLTARLAISQQVHVRDRILYLFSHLASRWGIPGSGGAIVPVPITHGQIAKLIGAQRPSVTIAIGELSEGGLLTRLGDRTWWCTAVSGRDTLDSSPRAAR
jgi:CRP-like cAMP-binding protein